MMHNIWKSPFTLRRQRLQSYMHGACQFAADAEPHPDFLRKGAKQAGRAAPSCARREKLKSLARLIFLAPVSIFSQRLAAGFGGRRSILSKKCAELATI